jgi:hypothetical protein
MPNGDPSLSSADWTKVKAFFEGLSPILLAFAGAHNLGLDEYYHEAPAWLFRFRHPKGGGGSIGLHRVDDHTIRVNRSWHVDEFETFTRYLKCGADKQLLVADVDLREVLEGCLKEIVAWDKKDLTAYSDYKKIWSLYSKEEWDKLFTHDCLPLLRL